MITIYTRENCIFCDQAKAIMKNRNLSFHEKKLGLDFVREDIVRDFPTMKTYPVIVNDGSLVGGFNEFIVEIHKGTSFSQLLKG
jgi:glutaredoxin